MSDLLSIGASAARAYGAALRTVGENVANADDPAYVRRRLALQESRALSAASPLYQTRTAAHGVQVRGVERLADPLLDAAVRASAAVHGSANVRADRLGQIESALADGPNGVGARMTALFDAATLASASPSDPARRLAVLSAVDDVAASFRATAARLDALDQGLALQTTDTLGTINGLLGNVAALNLDLTRASPGSAGEAQLLDRRDAALADLANLLGPDLSWDDKGGARIAVGGTPLVDGGEAVTLTGTRDSGGNLRITAGTDTAALEPLGGALGGLDGSIRALADRRTALDTLASDFATALNDWHAGGRTGGGAAGAALLSGGDAATLNATGLSPAQLAVAGGGRPNGNLLALDMLRGAGGGEEGWQALVYAVASQTKAATADADAAAAIADHALAARDQLSGVDLDREAADMLRLQQAYDASARVLMVARETLQSILAIF